MRLNSLRTPTTNTRAERSNTMHNIRVKHRLALVANARDLGLSCAVTPTQCRMVTSTSVFALSHCLHMLRTVIQLGYSIRICCRPTSKLGLPTSAIGSMQTRLNWL